MKGKSGQVVLAVGVLDMPKEFGPFAHEMHPASEQVSGRTHLSRVHIGLG